jgi:hypothetical protein
MKADSRALAVFAVITSGMRGISSRLASKLRAHGYAFNPTSLTRF